MDSTRSESPAVTFLVLCYKYAHFLPACVESILSQSFRDFELLILDDCSPDDTPAVAASFTDSRVRHIRHAANVGIVENFNRGLREARGRFLWCISADDRLLDTRVLERYVQALDGDAGAGMAFCPAVAICDDTVQQVLPWTTWPGRSDAVLSGSQLLKRASKECPVCAPTGLCRTALVREAGGYQPDLPRATDWYLWAAVAARSRCAYFHAPMVGYRIHAASMDHTLAKTSGRFFYDQETQARWRIVALLPETGHATLWPAYRDELAIAYAAQVAMAEANSPAWTFSERDAANHAHQHAPSSSTALEVITQMQAVLPGQRALAHTRIGDWRLDHGDTIGAVAEYAHARRAHPHSISATVRLWLAYAQKISGFPVIPLIRRMRSAAKLERRIGVSQQHCGAHSS